jgi:NAD(P)H dehydrogenase (quinone)
MLTSVLVAIGTPWPSAPAIAAFGRAVREGYFDVVDLVYECLAGHPPASLPEPLIAQRSDLLAMA